MMPTRTESGLGRCLLAAAMLAVLASTALVIALSSHAERGVAAVGLGAVVVGPFVVAPLFRIGRRRGDRRLRTALIAALLAVIVTLGLLIDHSAPGAPVAQVVLFGLILVFFACVCRAVSTAPRTTAPEGDGVIYSRSGDRTLDRHDNEPAREASTCDS